MPRTFRSCFTAVITILCLSGAVQADPVMFKGTPALTGVYQSPTPASLKGIKFLFRTGGPIRSAPAVSDGLLYFGNSDRTFYVLDAHTGAERWRLRTDSNVTSSPTIIAGMAYFTTRDSHLYAVDAHDGTVKWKIDLGRDLGNENYWDFYTSSPTPFGSTLYVGSGDGHVRAIDSLSGKEIWSFDAGSRVRSTPAVTDDVVVFGTKSGYVEAIDRKTGAARWKFATKGATNKFEDKQNDTTSVYASPTILDGVVVVGGRDGLIYGIDLQTGTQKWQTTHDGSSWILSTAAENGTVYIGSGSAYILQAADIQTGKEKWRYVTKSAIFGSPTIAGDAILFDDMSGTLYAVDKNTGKELWRFAMGNLALATPTVADGIVYAASDDGVLYALDTSASHGATPLPVKKYVYWEGKKTPDAAGWFQGNIDVALLNSFKSAGYEQLTAAQLQKAMNDQIAQGGRSVVVFTDGHVPPSVFDTHTPQALIRRYVDGGGRVIFLNGNPLTFVFDPKTGSLDATDDDPAEKVMEIHYPPLNVERGYHISQYTADGEKWGLQGVFVANGAIEDAQVNVVLARNEFGLATSWVKYYGTKGGAIVQLAVPKNTLTNMTPYQTAIETGLR